MHILVKVVGTTRPILMDDKSSGYGFMYYWLCTPPHVVPLDTPVTCVYFTQMTRKIISQYNELNFCNEMLIINFTITKRGTKC